MPEWKQEILKRLAVLKLSPAREAEIAEEMAQHLEDRYRELLAGGAAEIEARRAALQELSDEKILARGLRRVEHPVAQEPDIWGAPKKTNILADLGRDVRYGLRMLARNPGFTAVAVLTLALGIGANTSIFSIVNAVSLRPLPFPHSGRIFVVDRTGNQLGGHSISFPIYLAWEKRKSGLFENLALAAWWDEATIASTGEPERVPMAGASPELFSVLGMEPALGRGFLPEECRPGSRDVTILSYGLWRSRFGGDRNILGKQLKIDGRAHTVVGILPQDFQLPIPGFREAEIWLPVHVPLTSDNAANGALLCLGLLKKSVTANQAEAALTPPLSDLRREFPKMFAANERAHLAPLRSFLRDWAGPAPLLLLGAVGLVLLLACANVANLALARTTGRRKEISIRTAIGASRSRLVRQLLAESILLALVGGAFGLLACYASFDFIRALVPADLPHVGAFRLDWNVLLFSLLLSLMTGIVFGMAPALAASRVNQIAALNEANPRAGMSGRGRLFSALAVSEISISLMLLIGSALALKSFVLLMRVPPGFDPENLLTFNISLRPIDIPGVANRLVFYNQALERLRSVPEVEQVAIINALPFKGGGDLLFTIEGGSAGDQPAEALDADYRAITPAFFQTMRIPLLRGRAFAESDDANSQPVVIINQTMAKSYWPKEDPIGQRIWIGKPMGPEWTEPSPRTIIGIVGDVHGESLASPPDAAMYLPYAQRPIVDGYFVVRTRHAPVAAVPEIRSAIHQVDPELPLAQMQTMKQVISDSVTDWRFRTILLALFGALAVFIAATGVYGVISYSVSQRNHEFGVRMALGARRADILKLVVRHGLKLALLGVVVGLAGGFAVSRLLTSMLYGVRPTDWTTYLEVSLLLSGVVLLASCIPARRATKVDPIVALRWE
ncbi:MAG TPA: ABC transporter permease [Terriglobia bacterium]|nr:ABC transporter permease [Terriglobia bacterium]